MTQTSRTVVSCLLCDTPVTHLLDSYPAGLRRYLQCPNCGLLHEDPVHYRDAEFDITKAPEDLTQAERKRFQDVYGESIQVAQDDGELYKIYDYDDPDEMKRGLTERVIDRVRNSVHWQPDLKLLEIGCADGFLLRQLEGELPTATLFGVDPSPVSFAQAQRLGTSTGLGTLDIVDTAPYEPFDVVVALGNLMLHQDPLATLQLAAARMQPGGMLMFDVKNGGCSSRRLSALIGRTPLARLGPFRSFISRNFMNFRFGFDRSTLPMLVEKAGFELVSLTSIPPRALTFSNQHKGSNGLGGAVWRAFDWFDARSQNQAWLEVIAKKL